jgi:hypothetical protein
VKSRLFVSLSLPLLLFTPAATSQTRFGQISGRLIDRAGALIPGANNRLTNNPGKLAREFTTTSSGVFGFANVPQSGYSIRIAQHCFKHIIDNKEVSRA